MKKKDTVKALACLKALNDSLKNDYEILKKSGIEDFNLTYISATIAQIQEVSKSVSLLNSYYAKKKIKI